MDYAVAPRGFRSLASLALATVLMVAFSAAAPAAQLITFEQINAAGRGEGDGTSCPEFLRGSRRDLQGRSTGLLKRPGDSQFRAFRYQGR